MKLMLTLLSCSLDIHSDDFDDFCKRACELVEKSNGAPLFTVTKIRSLPKPATGHHDSGGIPEDDSFDVGPSGDAEVSTQEDDWQLL